MPSCRSTIYVPNADPRRCREIGWSCLVYATLLMAGCSRSMHGSGQPAANTTGPAANAVSQTDAADAAFGQHLGSVHVIGTGRRFVLVETPSAQPISTLVDGQALVCRAAGVVTSTLRVSHERRPPFVVADVAAGEPHVGDEVFIDTVPGHSMVPAPVNLAPSPSPNSQVPAATPDFHTNPALPATR